MRLVQPASRQQMILVNRAKRLRRLAQPIQDLYAGKTSLKYVPRPIIYIALVAKIPSQNRRRPRIAADDDSVCSRR